MQDGKRLRKGITIVRRGDGLVIYDFYICHRGRRYRNRVKCPEKFLIAMHDAWLEDVFSGKLDAEKKLQTELKLFETLEKKYLPWIEKNKSRNYFLRCVSSIKKFKRYLGRDRTLRDLTRKDALGFLDWVRTSDSDGRVLANATLNKVRGIFSFFYRTWCFDHGLLDGRFNPFERIIFREEKRDVKMLTAEQFSKMLKNCSANYQKTFLCLALYGAMRHGEILSLKWSDIDLDRRMIFLRKETTKTKQSRVVPIIDPLLAQLQAHMGEVGSLLEVSPYVIYDRRFRGMKMASFRKSWEMLQEKLPWLEGVRMHDLRHNGATMMMKAGVHPKAASRVLGHAKMKMTEHYTHLVDDDVVREMMDKERNIRLD